MGRTRKTKNTIRKATKLKSRKGKVAKVKGGHQNLDSLIAQIKNSIKIAEKLFTKRIATVSKLINKIELKTNKLLTQKDKATEKFSSLEQKMGDNPKAQDKKNLKKLRKDVDSISQKAGKSQQLLSETQKELRNAELEVEGLKALNETLIQFKENQNASQPDTQGEPDTVNPEELSENVGENE